MDKDIHKLDAAFVGKLKKLYPRYFTAICRSFLTKRRPAFRINYTKTDLRTLRRKIMEERVRCVELPFPKGAFLLKTPLRELQKRGLYQQGVIYVQNVSSMLPVIVLSPKNGEKILDLCAAPGAKTTQIVSLAPQAEVAAVEKIRVRYYKLLANLKIQGADNVRVYLLDGVWVRKKFPEYFDKILVDAPCSAEGRFFLKDPKSFKYWKERKVREMEHKQKKLLHSAFFALKEGGELVYSTCTFSPEENEQVADWFLGRFSGKLELLPVKFPLKNVRPGLVSWKGKRFSPSLRLTLRVVPNEYMEGFFIARFRKAAL